MMKNDIELTDEQLNDMSALQARKLFLLISSMPVEDDVKTMLLTMAENAGFDQLQEMTNFLEEQYANVATQGIDKNFLAKLEDLKKEHDENMAKLDEDFLNKLKDAENKL